MSILITIQQDALAARKARDTLRAELLTTLYAEAARVGKDAGNRASTDDEVVAVVKKFYKNAEEALHALWVPEKTDLDAVRVAKRDKLMMEQAVLAAYLPKQASPDEVRVAVFEAIAGLPECSGKHVGAVMSALTARFGVNFDKAAASKLAREILNSQESNANAH